ncbi:hypothetical protein ACZ91_60570 [Streptomyces regensis]|nr:hypothetical protein ACZ91_60570 [Streptomyces regensis]
MPQKLMIRQVSAASPLTSHPRSTSMPPVGAAEPLRPQPSGGGPWVRHPEEPDGGAGRHCSGRPPSRSPRAAHWPVRPAPRARTWTSPRTALRRTSPASRRSTAPPPRTCRWTRPVPRSATRSP